MYVHANVCKHVFMQMPLNKKGLGLIMNCGFSDKGIKVTGSSVNLYLCMYVCAYAYICICMRTCIHLYINKSETFLSINTIHIKSMHTGCELFTGLDMSHNFCYPCDTYNYWLPHDKYACMHAQMHNNMYIIHT